MIAGFQYAPEFVSEREEQTLLEHLAAEPFARLAMRGKHTQRAIVSYGLEFRPHVGTLTAAPPLPGYLHGIRARAAAFVELPAESLAQSLLTRYPAGSNIGWHVDHPSFGGVVVAVSLLGDATLSLRRGGDAHNVAIARRSMYVLRGVARAEYEHKVTARALRYSITLRPIAGSNERPQRLS